MPPITLAIGASSRSDVGATDQDLALTQAIDLFGQTRARGRLGAADLQIAMAKYRAGASQLQAEVLTAFAVTVSTSHQYKVALELCDVAEGLINTTKRRFEEGKVAEIQVTRASIEFERAKQATELRRADYEAAVTRLAGLLAVPTKELLVAPDASLEPLENPIIEERADILELQAQVNRAKAEMGVTRTASKPEFNLQVVRSPWSNDRGHFVGRAQITWNLWDHGKSRSEVRAAIVRAEAAQKALADAQARATKELEAVQIELESRKTRIKRYETILTSAKELVAKSQKGFSEGFGTQVDVLEANRALREVEQELVEAKEQLAFSVIKQYEAAGYLVEVLK